MSRSGAAEVDQHSKHRQFSLACHQSLAGYVNVILVNHVWEALCAKHAWRSSYLEVQVRLASISRITNLTDLLAARYAVSGFDPQAARQEVRITCELAVANVDDDAVPGDGFHGYRQGGIKRCGCARDIVWEIIDGHDHRPIGNRYDILAMGEIRANVARVAGERQEVFCLFPIYRIAS